LSTLLLRLGNLSITAIVARILDPRDFGVFAIALTAYTIISTLGQLGAASCLVRADLDIDAMAPTMVTVSLTTSAILAGAMAVFARHIAIALGSVDGTGPVRIMALVMLLEGVFAVPWAQLTRDFKQDKLFLANVISLVPSTAALLLLAKSGGGATAFAWSRVISTFVSGCVMVVSVPKIYRPGLARSALAILFNFGLPLAGANFVNNMLLNTDYAFIGHLVGAVELGVYVLAFNVASWPAGLLGSMINNVSMPAFSRVKSDPDLLKKAMTRSLRAVSLIAMPMCGLMMALARPLVLVLYGAKWEASAEVLSILSLYGAISIICVLFANMLVSLGKARSMLAVQLIWLGALVPAMALGVHRDGIVGAALAHIAIIAPLVLPSYVFALKRATGIRLAALGKAILPPLLATSAAALAARATASQFVSPLAQLMTGLAAGGLTYALAAAPQGTVLLSQEQTTKLRALRFFRLYDTAARMIWLPARRGSEQRDRDSGYQATQGPQLRANHPDLASTYADRQEAWSDQAVAVHKRTLADRERQLGPDHPHTVASRANLAYAYRQTGWIAEAIALYEKTLADWRRLLGPDHPRTLRSSNYLASAYRDAGRMAEATALYKRTLAERLRLLGPYHPSTLRSSNYLASTYREAGRLAEAIPLYEQVLAGWRRLFGPDHLSTLRSSNNLASTYGEAGRLGEAIQLYEHTLGRCAQVLGSDHALTRTVRRNLSVAQQLAASRGPYPGWPAYPQPQVI
jgi:lipopolysaccharide exporter